MKKKLLFISVLVACLSQIRAPSPVSPEMAGVLQRRLDSCIAAFDVPGISATLLLPGDRYWNGAAGVSDIYSLDPLDTAHVFYQASVTKMFVAAIVLQMIEQGLLSPDDSIGRYLPPIRTVPPATRIRYLLNQRSGIDNFLGENPAASSTWFAHPDSIWTPQLAIETYNREPVFNQGSAFAYSNTNYLLLGMLIEAITGRTFAEELRDRILVPYGMDRTFFPTADSIAGQLATGWTSFTSLSGPYLTDASVILNDCSASMIFTSGALVASSSDVARFTRSLFSGGFINRATLAQMKTCTNVNWSHGCNGYGYGTMRYSLAGKTYFGHAGDISGFTLMTVHQETDSVTLTISVNRNNAARGAIALALLDALDEALTVGTDETSAGDLRISVYPNPVTDMLYIDFAEAGQGLYRAELINTAGQIVSRQLMDAAPGSYRMDLDRLPPGVYYLRLSGGSGSAMRKLVVR